MWEDPIVAEVRKVRETHAAKFNYDLLAIYRDLKEQEEKSGRTFVSYPPRRCKPNNLETSRSGCAEACTPAVASDAF